MLLKLARIAFHSVLLFALPWLVGALTAAMFDVSEVAETGAVLLRIFAIFAIPAMVVQLTAVATKVAHEQRARRLEGTGGWRATVDAAERHTRVLSGLGTSVLLGSLALTTLALAVKWAELGVLAVVGLGLVYALAVTATVLSAFFVHTGRPSAHGRGGLIERELSPPLVEAGQCVEERFTLHGVPVPPGFRLLIHDVLPPRLGGETRRVVDRAMGPRPVTIAAPLPRTPRGEHQTGAATIWCEDVLGLTRVHVVSTAKAFLRVLPPVRPVVLDERIKSRTRAEGPEMRLARLPTDEHFRLREYAAGDDVRRIHWRLSVNTGKLHVRLPEAVPHARAKVTVVLDTFVPPHLAEGAPLLADLLDLLVEGWVGLAHALLARGEQVTLLVAAPDSHGAVTIHQVACRRGEELAWRALGARVRWQHELAPGQVTASQPRSDACLVLSGGAGLPGSSVPRGSVLLWAEEPALTASVARPPWWRRDVLARTAYPPGAEENRRPWRERRRQARAARRRKLMARQLAAATRGGLAAARSIGLRTLALRRHGPALRVEPAP